MTPSLWGMVLDGLVLVFLAGTMFFAARLSLHLKTFRNSRKDLEKLIKNLGKHIMQADQAIENLQDASRQSGHTLQGQIDESRLLLEELQLITEAGNSLASRLEKLAEGRGEAQASSAPRSAFAFDEDKAEPVRDLPSFFIRDPEFDRGEDDDDQGLYMDEGDDTGRAGADFHSRAERELFEALQAHHGKAGGRA